MSSTNPAVNSQQQAHQYLSLLQAVEGETTVGAAGKGLKVNLNRDTLDSLAGLSFNTAYKSTSSLPVLPPVNPSADSNTFTSAPATPADINAVLAAFAAAQNDTTPSALESFLISTKGAAASPSDESVSSSWNSAFAALVKGMPNEGDLLAAHFARGAGSPMTALEQEAFNEVSQQYSLPANYPTPPLVNAQDQQNFKDGVNVAFSNNFEAALANSGLSKNQQAQINYLFNNPGANVSGTVVINGQSMSLQDAVAMLSAQAQTQTIQQKNLSPDTTFKFLPNSAPYNAGLSGMYQENLNDQLATFLENPPAGWTDADTKALTDALKNPGQTVSERYASIVSKIQSQALAATQTAVGLQGIAIATPSLPEVQLSATHQSVLDELSLQLKVGANLINKMPEGPEKSTMLNLLNQITSALNEFKLALYASQTSTSESIKANSQAKLDMALASIALQKAQNDKIVEDSKKANKKLTKSQKVQKFFMAIFSILVAAFMVMFSPAAAPLFIMAAIDAVSACTSKPTSLMKDMFSSIVKAFGTVFGNIMNTFVVVFMVAACPIGATVLSSSWLESCGVIQAIVLARGGTQAQVDKAISIASMVLGIVIGIAITIASLGSAGVAAIGQMVLNIAKSALVLAKTFVQQGIAAGLRAIAQIIARAFATALSSAKGALSDLASMIKELGPNLLKFVKNLPSDMLKSVQNAIDGFLSLARGTAKMTNDDLLLMMTVTQTAIEGAQGITTAVSNVLMSQYKKMLAELAKAKGQMSADQTVALNAIQMLTNLLKKLMDILNGIVTNISSITSSQNDIMAGASSSIRGLIGA